MSVTSVTVQVVRGSKGRRPEPRSTIDLSPGAHEREISMHLDRKRRQLALAYKIDALIEAGEIASYSEVAGRLGVSRARLTQIMNTMLLPIAEQESLLCGGGISTTTPGTQEEAR